MSLPILILTLLSREPAAIAVTMPRAVEAMHAAIDAVAIEGALFTGADAEHRTAALLLAWSWSEARWDSCAVGDNGRAIGLLQVHGATDAKCDALAGMRAGLRMMRTLAHVCGSPRAGLGAFAAGRCAAAPKLVNARCDAAGKVC